MSVSHMQSADWSRTIKPNTVTAEYSSFMNNLFAIVRPKTTKSNCTYLSRAVCAYIFHVWYEDKPTANICMSAFFYIIWTGFLKKLNSTLPSNLWQ